MKKNFMIFLFICLLFPNLVYAKKIDVSSINASFEFPDDWYVFTRENITNNSDLEQLNIDGTSLNTNFFNNNIYVDAFPKSLITDGVSVEFFLQVIDIDLGVYNLTKLSDSSINDLIQKLKDEDFNTYYNAQIYKSKSGYKYIASNYKDSGYNIVNYTTIVNNKGYVLKLQYKDQFCLRSPSGVTEEYTECVRTNEIYDKQKDIIVDLVDAATYVETFSIKQLYDSNWFYVVIAVIFFILFAIISAIKKNKNVISNQGVNVNNNSQNYNDNQDYNSKFENSSQFYSNMNDNLYQSYNNQNNDNLHGNNNRIENSNQSNNTLNSSTNQNNNSYQNYNNKIESAEQFYSTMNSKLYQSYNNQNNDNFRGNNNGIENYNQFYSAMNNDSNQNNSNQNDNNFYGNNNVIENYNQFYNTMNNDSNRNNNNQNNDK